jgi:hypothetical protein
MALALHIGDFSFLTQAANFTGGGDAMIMDQGIELV